MAFESSPPTLVIMAAGRGARYGGAKQLDEVGPCGETLLDYAVFDARHAGFSHIVIVTRADLAPDLEARVRGFLPALEVRCAVQPALIPSGRSASRTRPWGTVHAVLSAGVTGSGPIVALNADDFYGRTAYERARHACVRALTTGEASVIAMRLDATLSAHGPVIRAVCEVEGDRLTRLDEVGDIVQTAGGIVGRSADGRARTLTGSELASMNMWVLPQRLVQELDAVFDSFVVTHANDVNAELPLPEAVGDLVSRGRAVVRVEASAGPWFGLTHSQDRETVAVALKQLAAEGVYPVPLWTRV